MSEKQQESAKRKPRSSKTNAARLKRIYRRLEAFDRDHVAETERLAGVDEAGRGALAGPVVAAAVVLPPGCELLGVNDSKAVGEADREALFEHIVARSLAVGIACSPPSVIDRENILNASLMAMARAIQNLRLIPNVVLLDGRDVIPATARVVSVIGGDGKSLSIAAASIIAKVTRDRIMRRLHRRYPVYNFMENKGYGTKDHLEAIRQYGVTREHRLSYRVNAVEKTPTLF